MANRRQVMPPSDDARWHAVHATMRRFGNSPQALIETLHTVQDEFGYLDQASLKYVANRLEVPLSSAYGVATFYHFFSLEPPAKHTCTVCLGTACYIRDSDQMMSALSNNFSIERGETTPDGDFSLQSAHCVGACALTPVTIVDGEIIGGLTPENVVDAVKERINHVS